MFQRTLTFMHTSDVQCKHPAYNPINAHSQTRTLLIFPQCVRECFDAVGQHGSSWIGLSIYQRCPALERRNFSDQWLPPAREPSLIFQLSGPHTALFRWVNKGQTPLPSNNPLYAQSNSQLGLRKLWYLQAADMNVWLNEVFICRKVILKPAYSLWLLK